MLTLASQKQARILITGATGLVGHALARELQRLGYTHLIPIDSRDCDLRDTHDVARLFRDAAPEFIFHLAARVYGIGGNSRYKSDILYDNVLINSNVVEHARRAGVQKIVAMGSGCVYPELTDTEALTETQIWDGPPHPSEDSYAHAKRLMYAHLCAAREQSSLPFAFAISGNLYGPHDNFNVEHGHVIPSLVAKFFEARRTGKPVTIWGTGAAMRDFAHAEDAAQGLLCMMEHLEGPVNLGSGARYRIADIVDILSAATGHCVEITWDDRKPDGQLERYYNIDKLKSCGFSASVDLEEGIARTFRWYEAHWPKVRQ